MLSCSSVKKLIPYPGYNIQRINRKCYIFDVDVRNYTYRYMVRENGVYYEIYNVVPLGRTEIKYIKKAVRSGRIRHRDEIRWGKGK